MFTIYVGMCLNELLMHPHTVNIFVIYVCKFILLTLGNIFLILYGVCATLNLKIKIISCMHICILNSKRFFINKKELYAVCICLQQIYICSFVIKMENSILL